MNTNGLRCLPLVALLVCVFLTTGASAHAQDEPGCEGVENYMRNVRTLQLVYDGTAADIQEADVDEWTPEQLTVVTRAASNLTAGLESINPPPAAVDFHAAMIASFSTWNEMLPAIAESGIFGVLTFIDQFEELQVEIDETGLAFELACNVAFVDHDDDGTPEIGLGDQATPSADASPSASFPAGWVLARGPSIGTGHDGYALTS